MYNENFKYKDNNDSSPANKILDYRSSEQETKFRLENNSLLNNFRLITGINAELADYYNRTNQQTYVDNSVQTLNYRTDLTLFKWGMFGSLSYDHPDRLFTVAMKTVSQRDGTVLPSIGIMAEF